MQLSTNGTDWNKLNKPEQKIKSLSKLSFHSEGLQEGYIKRLWSIFQPPPPCIVPANLSSSHRHLIYIHVPSIWPKLDVLMSFTGMLIWFPEVKWSSVSIYTTTQADICASHCHGSSPFTNSPSLKFIAPLKCVHTRVLMAGRTDGQTHSLCVYSSVCYSSGSKCPSHLTDICLSQ